MKTLVVRLITLGLVLSSFGAATAANAVSSPLKPLTASPVFHLRSAAAAAKPTGLSPAQIRAAYKLPATGGTGTIAIVDAYRDTTIGADLTTFSKQYNLPACTAGNGCLTLHPMSNFVSADAGWSLEMSLDVEWAHAIAPNAKLLLVEAKSANLGDLLSAVDYARGQSAVVAVSMSWAAGEFSQETQYDSHFVSPNGAAFYAASGDSGHGVTWPAVSPNVVGVGGTTLNLTSGGAVSSETAWNGSGGDSACTRPSRPTRAPTRCRVTPRCSAPCPT